MYESLLPIGTVVKVKNMGQKMMIFGVLQSSKAHNGRVFDYLAVPYPEGQFDPRMNIGFDKDDIQEIVFRGYEDKDRKAFLAALEIAGEVEAQKQAQQK